MVRTSMVELSTIEAAAYRQKLKDGGSGITIIKYDSSHPAIATIDKRTGECVAYNKYNQVDFPKAAFEEAVELTKGMPYGKKSPVRIKREPAALEETEEPAPEEEITVSSADYKAIVDKYTDKKGNLSYDLINKDFIQMAKKSKHVKDRILNNATDKELIDYVVRTKLESITNNRNLSDKEIKMIIDILNEVSPKDVLKEFKLEIRKMLKRD